MNRNTNAHFSEMPSAEIKRSTFDRSFSHKLSGNTGDIIPIFFDEILPGDTVQISSSKIIRFQTMLTPVMDNIYADVYWFFVPNRLVWDHWEQLMGANYTSAWTPQASYSTPLIAVPPKAGEGDTPNNNKVGTLLDYLGFPVELSDQAAAIDISALPVRGYCKIMNDWFLAETVSDPINIYTGDSKVTATTEASYINDCPKGGAPFKAAKFADYFSSSLPSPQRGSAVNITAHLDRAATKYIPVMPVGSIQNTGASPVIYKWKSPVTDYQYYLSEDLDNASHHMLGENITDITSGSTFSQYFNGVVSSGKYDTPVNLAASLSTSFDLGDVNISINDLRYAFQLQKLLERDARGGCGRYIEIIKAHFNVNSPDQRLQRSEYLGGNRFPVNITQVANQAQAETEFLGDLGAFSVTADTHADFVKSFTEHGMLYGLLVLRYDHTYSQGIPKYFQRTDRFSYYWPVFANIGEQPVNKSEIYGTATGTWGYQEAWADYRYKPNMCSGEMRPYVTNGLFSWTLADDYDQAPTLSDEWMREDKTNVDRTLSVTSQVSNQFWADIYFDFKHTRPMPVFSIPGLIDHN